MDPTRFIAKSSDTSLNGNYNEDPINLSSNWIEHAVQCSHCKNLLKTFLGVGTGGRGRGRGGVIQN